MADYSAARKQFFDSKRSDIERQAKGAQQMQEDAIQRRFSSLGASGSGAAIGAQIKGRESVEATKNQAFNELGGQELQANIEDERFKETLNEAQRGRDFQESQRKASEMFQSGESKVGREFAAAQAALERGQRETFFGAEQANKLKEFDLAERQFALEKDAQDFNKRMAEIMQAQEDPGLLGSGGFLGTGIGGKRGFLGTNILNNRGTVLPVLGSSGGLLGGGGLF